MKKLYTVLAAAAVVLSAAAGNSHNVPNISGKTLHRQNLDAPAKNFSPEKLVINDEIIERFAVSRTIVPEYEFEGLYTMTTCAIFPDATYTGGELAPKFNDKGQITNVKWDITAMPGVVELATETVTDEDGKEEEVEFVYIYGAFNSDLILKGEYIEYPVQGGVIPMVFCWADESHVYDQNGNATEETLTAFEIDITTGEQFDEFIFILDEENRELWWQCDLPQGATSITQATSFLVVANGTDIKAEGYKEYSRAYQTFVDQVNSRMRLEYFSTKLNDYAPASTLVYAEYDDGAEEDGEASDEQYITIYNMFGLYSLQMFSPADFLLDFDEGTGYASTIPVLSDTYVYQWDGDFDTTPKYREITVNFEDAEDEEGKFTRLTLDYAIESTYPYNAEESMYFRNISINLPFYVEGFNSGVKNVSVADSNAAVEYFNLQGIRVANPENGALYIRRQGKNVSKVIL